VGLSQAQVSRYEQDPGAMPAALLISWAQSLGTDIATLMSSAVSPPPPVDAGEPYRQLSIDLTLLEQYVKDAFPYGDLEIPNKPPTAVNIHKLIQQYRQKPSLVLVGRFDSGKSHLANALMGGKFLPSQYQPATRVITFVQHIDNRPDWFQEQVGILAEDFWPRDEKDNQVFDLTLLNVQSWFKKHCLKSGSLEVLRQHGIHDHLNQAEIEGHSAIVYVDSPLLKSCNIVDFPGYSDQEDQLSDDVKKASSAVRIADLVLYTSPANGFMNAEDFSRLGYLLRILPAPETNNPDFPVMGNFFVVATHANPLITDTDIETIRKVGAKRLHNYLKETVLVERSERIDQSITCEDLHNRFFTFWEETPSRWKSLKESLNLSLGEALPTARIYQINQEISRLKHEVPKTIADQIEAYEQTKNEVEQKRQELKQLEREEPERVEQLRCNRQHIQRRIAGLEQETQNSFEKSYYSLVNTSAVERMIQDQYRDKKQAKEYAAGYLIEQLQGLLESEIKENSKFLQLEIENFLETYDEALLKLPKLNLGSVAIPFDARGAFLGSLAGVGSVGAVAFWAASLGNLGAYILVAQFVSVLSALGISISGGVATAVSFVAAIGGPITLGIGLFAAIAALGWAVFGESWQNRLAKKIVKHFEENAVLDKFLEGSEEYWQDTAKGFNRGADGLEEKFQSYIQHLRDLCQDDGASKARIEKLLSQLAELKNFFAKIPWHIDRC
jgi:hypothetical protein